MKHENGIKTAECLNDSLNSIIMIDSENDEDCILLQSISQEKPMGTLTLTELVGAESVNSESLEESQKEAISIVAMETVTDSPILKVLVEKLDFNKITSEYEGLIIADSVFEFLYGKKVPVVEEADNLPIEPVKANSNKSATSNRTQKNNNAVKKLRSKSKTLPLPVSVASSAIISMTTSKPVDNTKYAGFLINGSLIDLNAITVVNPITKPINVMNNNGVLSTNPITNFRSKLRSTASSSQRTDVAPSLSICSVLPPSPAELLRKYSTSTGYTCEMDKLFKGTFFQ
jgi:hypothetical protein